MKKTSTDTIDFCKTKTLFKPSENDRFYAKISNVIQTDGWQIMGVIGDDQHMSFGYTIGNYLEKLPELLMIGGHDPQTISILNPICEMLRERGHAFDDGELIDAGCRFPFLVKNAGKNAKRDYTVQAGQYFTTEDYEVQQIVMPDRFGRYPSDPECAFPYCLVPIVDGDWHPQFPPKYESICKS